MFSMNFENTTEKSIFPCSGRAHTLLAMFYLDNIVVEISSALFKIRIKGLHIKFRKHENVFKRLTFYFETCKLS